MKIRLNTIFFRPLCVLAAFAITVTNASAATLLYATGAFDLVYSVSETGAVTQFADLTSGTSSNVHGLVRDLAGNIYVADGGTGDFFKITATGASSLYASISNRYPYGLTIDGGGNLFATVGGLGAPTIVKITRTNPPVVSVFSTPAGGQEFAGIKFGQNGDLFVVDDLADRILRITPAGVVSTFVTIPSAGTLMGLAFDASGDLFVSDFNGPIRRVTSAGAVSTFVTLPSGAGVKGLAFDTQGNLYAAEQNRNTIAKITPAGTVTDYASFFAPQDIVAVPGVIPEPSPFGLFFVGMLALTRRRRRIPEEDTASYAFLDQ